MVSKSDYSADDMAAMRNTESSTPGKMLQYATQLRETQRLDLHALSLLSLPPTAITIKDR